MIIWKMRTELAYQWELVEDEINVVYEWLGDSVRGLLNELKQTIIGKSSASSEFVL